MGNNGKGLTKADVILTKVDKLSKKVASIESQVAGDAVIRKLAEENAKLKKEISYVSAQIEGLFTTLSKMIQKLPEQVGAKAQTGIDPDKLAAMVADRIDIPAGERTTVTERAPRERVTVTADGIDYDELSASIARRIYIPQAIAQEVDYDRLAEKVTEKMPPVAVDYDDLGYSIAKRIYIPQAIAEDVDYQAIADKVIEKMPDMVTVSTAADETAYASAAAEPMYTQAPVYAQTEIDYDLLASKLAEVVSVQETISPDYIAAKVAEQIIVPQSAVTADSVDLDVEELSRKVADKIAIPAYEPNEAVSEERIAEAVADRLREIDETAQATPAGYEANIDEQALAEDIANRLNFSLSDELIAAAVVKNLSDAIDSDEIADCVAKKVGSISPEQFEITVDDDGCDSLAKAVESKLDYDVIAAAVAEKLNPAFMATSAGDEIDAEELARAISEKLSVNADINEDLLADKAAAILSNYMPEIDSADIADKVVAGIIPALPSTPVIDSEGIAYTVSERLVENQENNEYDIVIDEEGLTRITDGIADEMSKESDEHYRKLDGELEEIKDEYGKRFDKIDEAAETAREENDSRFNKIDEEIAQIKAMLLSGIVVASNVQSTEETVVCDTLEDENAQEEQLVTVSDIVGDIEEEEEPEEEVVFEEEAEPVEEVTEEAEEEPEEEAQAEEAEEEPVAEEVEEPVTEEEPEEVAEAATEVAEIEEEEEEEAEEAEDGDEDDDSVDIDVNLSVGEGEEGAQGGVDFLHMMKYNRSFIARIIQGSDEQKNYYGRIKTALLSYKKVNSNVAWGAERFNKGRETIARLKIRGKTLVLYLALDPKEVSYSVYHQVDVSDNKSLHGTPCMVKVKSPLGVKKAIRLIDEMLEKRNGEKHNVAERDYAAMYPYETIEELIEDGLVKDVNK